VDGDGIYRMMQVTGEEGISLEDYIKWQKSVLLDMVYLQQDAFDDVDASMSLERQAESFKMLQGIIGNSYAFTDRDHARDFFTNLTSLYKNWNYAPPGTPEYDRYRQEITDLVEQHDGRPERRSSGRDEQD
jgi:V/A-type H+-transporting ATPase subunit A